MKLVLCTVVEASISKVPLCLLLLKSLISERSIVFDWQKFWGSLIIKNKTQTAVTNMVSFRIFINLTFRVLFNIHFQK